MTLRLRPLAAVSTLACAAALFAPGEARACGGCFAPPSETTVVTGHRMAFAVSPTHTVLWDQIQYAGSPSGFAWVLPIKPGAHIEVSNDAWFEALDAATSARVIAPPTNCGGWDEGGNGSPGCSMGCGVSASDGSRAFGSTGGGEAPPPPPVSVVHQGTVGPYETVTLHANEPNALPDWLTNNGFAIDDAIDPVINAYVAEGFDFIALRLLPGQGVQQMKPVRVVMPGMSPTLPLRMVAAGAGAKVALTLFVIGEGRWQAENFPNGTVNPDDLVWDFKTSDSNYAALRLQVLSGLDGRTWNTAYSQQRTLLATRTSDVTMAPIQYNTQGGSVANTIGELYIRQGFENGETNTTSCLDAFPSFSVSNSVVVDTCQSSTGAGGGGAGGGGAGGGGTGGGAGTDCVPGQPGLGEIAAHELACGTLDDLAVAFTGLHPKDVWLTRLEANLPSGALVDDLNIEASPFQTTGVDNWMFAQQSENSPCGDVASTPPPPDYRGRTRAAFFAVLVASVAAALGRRARRPARRPQPAHG